MSIHVGAQEITNLRIGGVQPAAVFVGPIWVWPRLPDVGDRAAQNGTTRVTQAGANRIVQAASLPAPQNLVATTASSSQIDLRWEF